VLQKDVIPLAKKHGCDFTPEDLAELQTTKISDEELDQVVGGRGQFTQSNAFMTSHGAISLTLTNTCDLAPDDQTLLARYNQWPTDCPDYVWVGIGSSYRSCANCAHFQCYES
jgi:hypothetical protein